MYRETFTKSPILWVDAGNWAESSATQDSPIKNQMLLSAMSDLGYMAANVSERELANGYEAFLDRRKSARFPFVSANVVFQSSGAPIVDPYTLVTLDPKKYPALTAPLRVAITGVTKFNPTFLKAAPPKDNVVISIPADELRKQMPEMRRKADQVVVLAAMSRDDAHLLAREVPGIDLVVGAYLGMITAVEDREGDTPIFFVGNQGKYVAELRMARGEDGKTSVSSNLHYLNVSYPEEPAMKARVEKAIAEINALSRVAASQGAAPLAGSAAATAGSFLQEVLYLTSEGCKDCHPSEYDSWRNSKHAHAMETLVAKQSDFNAECVGCHVVAFQRKGGFIDMKRTPTLANVQCESCHGPGARHIKNPAAPYGKAGPLSCVSCHNKANSPAFDFSTYWPRIQHGG